MTNTSLRWRDTGRSFPAPSPKGDKSSPMARIEIGEHLAADTRICGGRLIFKGSRILVSDVLELAEAGYTPEAIAQQYRGIIGSDAVREAVDFTRQGVVREVSTRKTAA